MEFLKGISYNKPQDTTAITSFGDYEVYTGSKTSGWYPRASPHASQPISPFHSLDHSRNVWTLKQSPIKGLTDSACLNICGPNAAPPYHSEMLFPVNWTPRGRECKTNFVSLHTRLPNSQIRG